MSKHNVLTDAKLVFSGLQKVFTTQLVKEKAAIETKFRNSSIHLTKNQLTGFTKTVLSRDFKNDLERASMVPIGIQAYLQQALLPKVVQGSKVLQKEALPEEDILVIKEEDLDGIYIRSLGVELVHDDEYERKAKAVLDKHSTDRPLTLTLEEQLHFSSIQESPATPISASVMKHKNPAYKHPFPTQERFHKDVGLSPNVEMRNEPLPQYAGMGTNAERFKVKPLPTHKPTSRLGATSKERKVPASRVSRIVTYGGLAAGLGIGAAAEFAKRSLGLGNTSSDGVSVLDTNPFLSDANAERIVDTLCRVRGAALKMGQILSIQDDTMINPKLQQIFERVRHAADFMPSWQMERMMESELGPDWKTKLLEFDMKPFAAASIGQVHLGKLIGGRPVAVKVQYPGVAKGIESDIDNLMAVLNVWKILPDGIFADNIIQVAKRELKWEVDYVREMECAKRFKILLEPYPDYYVPEVIEEFTTKLVYTTELIEGVPVDKCESMDQATRDRICYLMLDLFFREVFEFRFMQTDPNWSNFLYNTETQQIGLLDFGASRDYSKEFTDMYLQVFKGAATGDTKLILDVSRQIGFLTGYESKVMEKAHVESVMILGEPFRLDKAPYDFGSQNITQRIQELVPVMVKERLCPPPEEIYSLHRKLSGVFLLCARLKGKVRCRPMFDRAWENYQKSKSESS